MFATPFYRRFMAKIQQMCTTPCTNTVQKYLKLEYIHEKTRLKHELEGQVSVGHTSFN